MKTKQAVETLREALVYVDGWDRRQDAYAALSRLEARVRELEEAPQGAPAQVEP